MLKKLGWGVLGLVFCGLAIAAEWNLQPAASKMAADFHWLHEAIMVLVIALFVGVFGVMFWSCYAHRKSVGRQAEQFHKNMMVEILWTVIPAIILAVIAWPVTKVVIAQKDASSLYVTKQINHDVLAAVITFTRNNLGNKTAEMIQPADIKGHRKLR